VSRLALGPALPPVQRLPVTLSPGVKRLWRETDHSPPSTAKVKVWSCTTYPPVRLHVVALS
jgi:hypothetical protein